jgi:transcriptional regulator with XRE-family HTH domain
MASQKKTNEIAAGLRAMRLDAGFTMRGLAAATQSTAATVCIYEHGNDQTKYNLDLLRRFAAACGYKARMVFEKKAGGKE